MLLLQLFVAKSYDKDLYKKSKYDALKLIA